jgi:transporter family-2 protein
MKYAALMLAAGMGVPILAALNAQLGGKLQNPAAAAVCLFAVALLCALAVFAVGGMAKGVFVSAAAAPKHLFLGGVLIAFYVLAITWVAPRFGVGSAIFFVLLGQLASAAVIDHFGLFGAQASPISAKRAAGLVFMAAGALLAQQGR